MTKKMAFREVLRIRKEREKEWEGKGPDRGEFVPAKQVPDTEPGKDLK